MGETSALGSLLLKHNYAVHLKSERPVPRGSERCSHEASADPHNKQKPGMASSSHLPVEEPASSTLKTMPTAAFAGLRSVLPNNILMCGSLFTPQSPHSTSVRLAKSLGLLFVSCAVPQHTLSGEMVRLGQLAPLSCPHTSCLLRGALPAHTQHRV